MRYGVIAADPPWSFTTWSKTRQTRSAETHYGVMTLQDIKDLPVADWCLPDCVLHLWSLNSMLPQALEVITAWGFTYKTVSFTWVKQTKRIQRKTGQHGIHTGMGYWTRQNSESVIFATRGKPKRLSRSVPQIILAPRREHSRKPEEFYRYCEALSGGPYLDMFSRESRPGWDQFGNETHKFNA